jgi:hypothetical protein
VLADEDDVDDWYKQLNLSVFPTTKLYDRAGKLVQTFEAVEPKEIEQAVRELLKK